MASPSASSWTAAVPQGHGEEVFRSLSRTFSRQTQNPQGDDLVDEKSVNHVDDWKLLSEVQGFREQSEIDHAKGQKLGVTWKDLTVKGIGADHAYLESVISQFNLYTKINEMRQPSSLKTIIEQSHGCVKPGEMLLVLGRPGSGTTTLLKMLSNRRLGYKEVTGDIHFGSMTAREAQRYRGQIVMNTEEEIFFPTLTVGQTIDFATRLKVPSNLPSKFTSPAEYQRAVKHFLLRSMDIEHTADTKVGNEFVRGVSGGERKRTSIIEVLATRASVFCWDNSTRGLDASTALEYTKAIRALTDVLGIASIMTLYQAGNGIYNLFDKVLVLEKGKQVYYGPRREAQPFMENLGFQYTPGANIADFLTSVTVPTERKIKEGFDKTFPRSADAIRCAYDRGPIKASMAKEYDYPETEQAREDTAEFKEAIAHEKSKSLPKTSPLMVSMPHQIESAVKRQFQLLWGDKASFMIKQGSTIVQSLIAGSLFYNAPPNSSGLFIKGGSLFFALLYNSLMAMSEVTDSFTARPVLAKHRSLALHHPAAFCLAQIATDIPILIFQVTVFSLPLYWMTGLKATAAAFFTFWVVVFAATMCLTALFRAIGAAFHTFDSASKVSGFATLALIMYIGYMIPIPQMHVWFRWIHWINPLSYGYDAILSNEFHDENIPCVNNNLVPNGPGYTDLSYQACTGVSGARTGDYSVTGTEYLDSLDYSFSTIWRNFGIIWAWWALFVVLTIIFTSNWNQASSNSGFLVIPREKAKLVKHLTCDEESQTKTPDTSANSSDAASEKDTNRVDDQLVHNTSVFTWRNLTYTVKTPSGDRVLLDNVQGWVKPGQLGALMGSSGAGKTTLLDVLAQRKTEGTIKGNIMVDGRPLPVSFQRSAGYCEQLDVHEPLSTVREALVFSALLRQSRDVLRAEKLRYVDTIIDLLELRDIENTVIGTTAAGLSVEQRKRLTIGVELVAKPSILIFLDEPTSGLDGQAAYNIVRFLRKLADVGQAVLVTIHQPSASLFAQFDTLLLLARGGKTVYFGDIGENAQTLKDYFGKNGAPCPPNANPAEHIIDVVSGTLAQGKDWNEVWLSSSEHSRVENELEDMIKNASANPPGSHDDGREFATSWFEQVKEVTNRMNVSLYRNTDYANNKFALHIGSALFNGFSFWMIGTSVRDLQLRLFTVFQFVFVAPGVIAQLQPLFIERRDIFEAREKKSKMYHWSSFVTGLIVSELPYLVICAVLYFLCWYYTVGFPLDSKAAGGTFFVMLFYEFVYTGIGQAIAAYAPNAVFASLANPFAIGVLVSFAGVLVPYSQINVFWRYWLYWLNPYTYLMGSLLTFDIFGAEVKCTSEEFAVFDTPGNQTCGNYLADYLQGIGSRSNLVNPDDVSGCKVCQYRNGADYLYTLNIHDYYYGWRDAALVVLFTFSSYGCVYLLMKLRTKASKKAE